MKKSKFFIGLAVVLFGAAGAYASSKANYRFTYWYNVPSSTTDKCQSVEYPFGCAEEGEGCVGIGGVANGQQLYRSDGATPLASCVTPLARD